MAGYFVILHTQYNTDAIDSRVLGVDMQALCKTMPLVIVHLAAVAVQSSDTRPQGVLVFAHSLRDQLNDLRSFAIEL